MILYINYLDFGEYCLSSYTLPDRHVWLNQTIWSRNEHFTKGSKKIKITWLEEKC